MDKESPEVTAVGPTLILPLSFSRLVLGATFRPSHLHTRTHRAEVDSLYAIYLSCRENAGVGSRTLSSQNMASSVW